MQKKILLSIKPEYANKILSGEKRYEFRRAIFKDQSVKKVIIYASSPVQRVIGEFTIGGILSKGLSQLWQDTKADAGIDKEFYDSYFIGKEKGYAIHIESFKKYKSSRLLETYNVSFPPQSFCYL